MKTQKMYNEEEFELDNQYNDEEDRFMTKKTASCTSIPTSGTTKLQKNLVIRTFCCNFVPYE